MAYPDQEHMCFTEGRAPSELNPGPKRQATLTNMPHSTPDQAPMDDLKLLIINLSAEVNRLGEKMDARLLNIEKKMEDWDRRMTGIETVKAAGMPI
ncbi:hypothetical protein LAZ67_23001531 [Cordylochernes scorpioides]|uniref:Uncharacterized protein n=1 Tax=Cordylochernes scorpioides TaxID=51811 RepID=A0ABY6LTB5_9ARAC|nr:hypothetical protein LAZ67_23001531 [Cordylochernes scorpioides]